MFSCRCKSEDLQAEEAVDRQLQQALLGARRQVTRRQNFLSPPATGSAFISRPTGVFSFKTASIVSEMHTNPKNLAPVTSYRLLENPQAGRERISQFIGGEPLKHPQTLGSNIGANEVTKNQRKVQFRYERQPQPCQGAKSSPSSITTQSWAKSQKNDDMQHNGCIQPRRDTCMPHQLKMRKPISINVKADSVRQQIPSMPFKFSSQSSSTHLTVELPGRKHTSNQSVPLPFPLSRSQTQLDSDRSFNSIIDALKEERLHKKNPAKLKAPLAIVEELPSPCYSNFSGWKSPTYDRNFIWSDPKTPSQNTPNPSTNAGSQQISPFNRVSTINESAFQ